EDKIIEAIHREKPRLFAISAVEWCSGYRFDLQTIGRACREEGTFFFVDAAQALGFTDIDVRSCHISALAGSAWKWLFGPAGQGYLYLRKGLLDEITPVFVGSNSVVEPYDYLDFNFELQPDMRRFEYSTENLSALVWWEAGLRFLNQIGLESLREYVFDLQDYAAERLSELGCSLRGVGDYEKRSGIMAFAHPEAETAALRRHLLRRGIVAQERDGCIRLAFHIYSTRSGIDLVVDATRKFLDQAS
ncbi:MAG: aminotransferase class V-fold PLP-dependent enzyme, partial [Candidatus Sumerlaeota bacterium]